MVVTLPQSAAPKRRGRPPADPAALAATSQEMKATICVAALKLFEQGGVEAVNMRDIGKALGVSPMMAYRYFPSKDHLLMELRIRAFSRFAASLARWRRRARAPEEALPLVCGAYLMFAYAHPHDYRLMFDMWAFEDVATMKAEFGEKLRRQSASWLEIQGAISDHLGDHADKIDLGQSTDIVWSTLHGVASLHLARKFVFGRSIRQLARPTIAAIVAGVTARRI
ncbi:TetR/AcrR family transcriptional regulator [Caulobacter sp. AP07]|uniref:TetR/AcrR family transcriptional regulator n=1 Tax=Caulobacter sp. AP07 TaxID=1144304 RepID=UPI0002F877FB|nr:TetR/AcrR family transcriptional regulator [Caulobacter sp. AP07]